MRFYKEQGRKNADEYQSTMANKSLEVSKVLGELKEAQLKLLESGKMSALASLSAGVLHQISQPVTALHGVSRFLKKELDPNSEYYKAVCMIDEQSDCLKSKLEDIMELIRHRKIRKENVDVNDMIARVMSLLMDELRVKGIKWHVNLGQDLPQVFADSVHLQQIFINIVTNAIQAMDSIEKVDDRFLQITTQYESEKNEMWISFQDSGPGITDEDRKHIFEPFFPVISMRAGIGLALCKDLIDEHSGDIDFENVEEGGAVFIIKLPCVKENKA